MRLMNRKAVMDDPALVSDEECHRPGRGLGRLGYFTVASISAVIAAICLQYSLPSEVFGLVATERVHDFGRLLQGATVNTTFELVNASSDQVRVVSITPSCDCTRFRLSDNVIPAWGKATLSARWETRTSRGKTGTQLLVNYLDGDRKDRLLLGMTGSVTPDYDVTPGELTINVKERATRLVAFKPNQWKDLVLKQAYCDRRGLRARVLPPGNQVEVSFDPVLWADDPAATYGLPVSARLNVETNSPHEPLHVLGITLKDGETR